MLFYFIFCVETVHNCYPESVILTKTLRCFPPITHLIVFTDAAGIAACKIPRYDVNEIKNTIYLDSSIQALTATHSLFGLPSVNSNLSNTNLSPSVPNRLRQWRYQLYFICHGIQLKHSVVYRS